MLTKSQLEELVSNYAEYIVDGMDQETLEQFACDSIAQSFEDYTAAELYDEIVESYNQEVFESLLPVGVAINEQKSLYDEIVQYYTQHSNL